MADERNASRELLELLSDMRTAPHDYINESVAKTGVEESAKYALEISHHILEGKYNNLMFLDISARGMASVISHTLYEIQQKQGKRKKEIIIPRMMFIDPNGINDLTESASQMRRSYIGATRNNRTLVLDTCSHSGDSLDKVQKTLQRASFLNVQSLVISGRDMSWKSSNLVSTIIDPNYEGCYPFGRRTDRAYVEGSIHTRNDTSVSQESLRRSLDVTKKIIHKVKKIV